MPMRSPAEILGTVLGKVDKVDGLCAVMGQLNEQGAGNFGRFLGQQSEGEMLSFVRGLNTASPAELRRIAAALNAGQMPTADGSTLSTANDRTPGRVARPKKEKTCPRCKKVRTDSKLTCAQCGYTDWGAIAVGTVIGVLFMAAALFWAPNIESSFLQEAVRWGGGILGAVFIGLMPVVAIEGLLMARKVKHRIQPSVAEEQAVLAEDIEPNRLAFEEASEKSPTAGPIPSNAPPHKMPDSAEPTSMPESEWPRSCLIERPCRDKEEAIALSRHLGKFKNVIESVRVSPRANGVVLKVATKPITKDVYDSIKDSIGSEK